MRTVVFNQGFNRVEHHQIICLERAKLNRLLDEERRLTEALIESVKQKIEARPQILVSIELMWNKIQSHNFVQDVRRRVDCLTDAYPQFLRQVEVARARIREKTIAALRAITNAAHLIIFQNEFTPSAQRLVVK